MLALAGVFWLYVWSQVLDLSIRFFLLRMGVTVALQKGSETQYQPRLRAGSNPAGRDLGSESVLWAVLGPYQSATQVPASS